MPTTAELPCSVFIWKRQRQEFHGTSPSSHIKINKTHRNPLHFCWALAFSNFRAPEGVAFRFWNCKGWESWLGFCNPTAAEAQRQAVAWHEWISLLRPGRAAGPMNFEPRMLQRKAPNSCCKHPLAEPSYWVGIFLLSLDYKYNNSCMEETLDHWSDSMKKNTSNDFQIVFQPCQLKKRSVSYK